VNLGPSTMKELRLRHAELEAMAQRLRDRAVGMGPTRATTSGTLRQVRSVQARADEYAALLRMVDAPSLERMEEDVITVLTSAGVGEVQADILEPGLVRARALMGSLFDHWRSQR
jgi:hypothetical protein